VCGFFLPFHSSPLGAPLFGIVKNAVKILAFSTRLSFDVTKAFGIP
jgi:hypothetical protein